MSQTARALMLFDGVCNFCSGAVQFAIPRDPEGRLRFAAMQSAAGRTILSRLGMPLDDYETFALIEGGRVYTRSDGVLRLARHLRWPWPLLSVFRIVPRMVRDWAYDRMARNRYRIAGRRDTCLMPTRDIRDRFLDRLGEREAHKALAFFGIGSRRNQSEARFVDAMTVLPVTDVLDSEAFYCDTLGFRSHGVNSVDGASRKRCVVERDAVQFMLDGTGGPIVEPVSVVVRLSDAEPFRRVIAEKGVAVELDPLALGPPAGFSVRDPDGHRLIFVHAANSENGTA